jgi:hypothetical protein
MGKMSDGAKQRVADTFLEHGTAEQAGRLYDLRRQATKALDDMTEILHKATGTDVWDRGDAEDIIDIDDLIATGWARLGRPAIRRTGSRKR